MVLSDRLEAILAQLSKYSGHECLADIGCDHGYTCIEAVKRGYVGRAIAMDVRKGPLSRAAMHISQCPYPQAFEVRLSDGLDALRPKEADVILISGMGGDLMRSILERGKETAMAASLLILQPQKDVADLRRYLSADYRLLSEDMVREDGKYYLIMSLCPEPGYRADYTEAELAYGRLLLESRHRVLGEYLEEMRTKQLRILQDIRAHSEEGSGRAAEMEQMLAITEEALGRYV